ncbi:MAG TPA: ABC transporter substrate-binding protein [Methylomirabilota bacterium]|nr:ABC transporter substrate-binding protein [Methylomirabilota bacterium]
MIDRRGFLSAMITLAAAPSVAMGQQSDRARNVPRIAFLCASSCSALPHPLSPADQAFARVLERGGYVIGKNVVLDMAAVGVSERGIDAAARRLASRHPTVILVSSSATAHAARRATRSASIVMMGIADPVEEGLIDSLHRPGGNLTGVALPFVSLVSKQIELLKEIQPSLRKIAVLFNPATRQHERLARAERTVGSLGVSLHPVPATTATDVPGALAAVKDVRADAIVVLEHLSTTFAIRDIVLFALQERLPAAAVNSRFVQGGGLLAYGPDEVDVFERSATYVVRLLGGNKTNELPVEEPTRYELSLNIATARTLRLVVPHALLIRASQVVE